MAGAVSSGGKKRGGIVAINITPMVDVMLVLLVIMMVSATYIVQQSLKVELPKSGSADAQTAAHVAKVSVTKDGQYYFEQQPIAGDADLNSRFKDVLAQFPDVSIVVQADKQAMHGDVVHVIDLAKQNGILKFAISVSQGE